MATVVLQAVGAAVGSYLGGPIGAVIGRTVGAVAGAHIDQQLFGPDDKTIVGPRLSSVQALSSREGVSIPQVYGRARVSGEIIWATRFVEVRSTETQSQGGKGGGGGGAKTTVTSYSYYANFAIGLCEGEIAGIRRIWVDGKIIKNTSVNMRVYKGSEDQLPDSMIEAKQGAGNAPAYRGLAYVVFEMLPLEDYGNRIPQIAIEILRPIGGLEKNVRAVNLIPGSTEFGYDTNRVSESLGAAGTRSLNVHQTVGETDFLASLDELISICPNLEQVALVVSWFGDDLRAGHCSIQPCVETPSRNIKSGAAWRAGGISRGQAKVVSQVNGSPAFGGTPSDASVLNAIAAIKGRGLRVCLNPFVMMDIADDNDLPSPYGSASQDVYPWRGRITCSPADGQLDSIDGSSAAASQVASFVGNAQMSNIAYYFGKISHNNLSSWSYRRFILHYLRLAQIAGGVDMFIIGSEFRGLTSVRDENDGFPFVDALADIADEAKSLLGSNCLVTYGADWSEYFGFQPSDGSGDVYYNLDTLWAKNSIDAIGIDNYMPISDWRPGGDPEDLWRHSVDPNMLASNIANGEGFDWYYASEADRRSGSRTAITDGLNKPWVYRYKDLKSWWSNQHYDRRAGVELSEASPWVPYSKPFIFTEYGCPAIHNGPAQPNVFSDPKSSENAIPYFSGGGRDDSAQAGYIEAIQGHWDDSSPSFQDANNPISAAYNGRMVDFSKSQLWAWDARPFPAFPSLSDIWSDGDNWRTGHWLNGRLGSLRLSDLISKLVQDSGITSIDVLQVREVVDGYIIAETTSPRHALEVLISLYQLTVFENEGTLIFRSPGHETGHPILHDNMVLEAEGAVATYQTEQLEDLPTIATLHHIDPSTDFQDTESVARRTNSEISRRQDISAPLVCTTFRTNSVIENWLRSRWIGRETVQFGLPKANLNLTVGDEVILDSGDYAQRWRIQSVEESEALLISAKAVEAENEAIDELDDDPWVSVQPVTQPAPLFHILDLPYLTQDIAADSNRIVATATPWTSPMTVYSSPTSDGYVYRQTLNSSGFIGKIHGELRGSKTTSRWDRGSDVIIELYNGSLISNDKLHVLNGSNALAVRSQTGAWEVLQFQTAELISAGRWKISEFLRGQAGTEVEAEAGSLDGADVVVLNQAVVPLENAQGQRGLELNWMVGPLGGVLGDPEFSTSTEATGYRGLVPFSPVHLHAISAANGDLQLNWIRRTRVGGDDWTPVEISNVEESETYRVFLSDGAGKSLFKTTNQSHTVFDEWELSAEFGNGVVDLTIEVSQLSATTGAGPSTSLLKTINL